MSAAFFSACLALSAARFSSLALPPLGLFFSCFEPGAALNSFFSGTHTWTHEQQHRDTIREADTRGGRGRTARRLEPRRMRSTQLSSARLGSARLGLLDYRLNDEAFTDRRSTSGAWWREGEGESRGKAGRTTTVTATAMHTEERKHKPDNDTSPSHTWPPRNPTRREQ